MKKILYLFVVMTMIMSSCQKYNDEINQVNNRVDNLEERIVVLEELCNQMNTNIASLQTIVEALQKNDYVQSITPLMENGKEVGYTITFTKSGAVTIYHGKDGNDGQNGTNGVDGHTPQIGVKQDTSGVYFWTVDGEWLLDDSGNKIKAVGTDGKDGHDGANGNDGQNGNNGSDGKDGVNGTDGVTPELKIENDYWYVSYDNGTTWKQLGKATGDDGQDGTNGTNGKDGKDSDSFFQSITEDENNVYITLTDGSVFTLPKTSSYLFNRLQSITYIPKYSDGKATMFYTEKSNSFVELDFKVTPADAVTNLQNISSVEAVYTQTRSNIHFINMEILSWITDAQKGIITVRASGKNLSDTFFEGNIGASVCLTMSGKDAMVASDFIPMTTKKIILTDYVLETTFKASAEQIRNFPNNITGNNKIVTIDYGDGTFGDELSHTYTETGNYAIKFYFENPITSIKQNAFSHYSVTSICIPKSVTSIEKYAFYNATSLESVKFEDDNVLYQIGEFAFGNTKIKEITIPKNVTSIGEAVFVGSKNLEKIYVQVGNKNYIEWDMSGYSNVLSTRDGKNIIAYASGSTMQEFRVLSNPVTIRTNSFSYCENIISIYMPIKEIEPYNFNIGCNALSSLDLGETSKIGNSVLNNCPNLCLIEAPKASEIGQNCFNNNSSMTEINLGSDELSSINYMGNDNAKLRNIFLPKGVTTISNSFNNCASIEIIHIRAINPPALTNSFNYITAGTKIYVPTKSLDAYKAADGWKDYADKIEGYVCNE